jgi:biotin synthase-related radical SAM superfamily protein
MKYLNIILLVFLYACSNTTAQSNSHESEEDKKFRELLSKVDETRINTAETQKKAEEKQAKIVDKTVKQIVELKNEVNELKQELNSITSDTAKKFKLLPISDY